MATITERNGIRMLTVGEGDAILDSVRSFTDLVGDCLGEGVSFIVIPVGHISEDFFQLRTGLAGEVLQKLVNYRIKLAIVGDVSRFAAASNAFRDLLIELERGSDVFVVDDLEALDARLAAVA